MAASKLSIRCITNAIVYKEYALNLKFSNLLISCKLG